jgi:TrmH family RNA methyltransferase
MADTPTDQSKGPLQDKSQIFSSQREDCLILRLPNMFETIQSVQNPRVKNLVRLREGSHRRRQSRFIIEGAREFQRALACGWPMESFYFCEDLFKDEASFGLVDQAESAGLEIIRLLPEAFAKAAFRQGPDGILATGIQRDRSLSDLQLSPQPFIVVLESPEKPGNIGAVFRTANAAGADAVIITNVVTDPYNPNAIRASQGAFFEIPFCCTDNEELLLFLEERHIKPVPTSPEGEQILWEVDLKQPVAILLGSENNGLSADWLDAFPACKLPMKGVTDSLNVASMAAIALFETVRQRSLQD